MDTKVIIGSVWFIVIVLSASAALSTWISEGGPRSLWSLLLLLVITPIALVGGLIGIYYAF